MKAERTVSMNIRVSQAESESFKKAASYSGLSLSDWIRTRLRKLSTKELQAFGASVPFVKAEGIAAEYVKEKGEVG